jgi:hypothetical protein
VTSLELGNEPVLYGTFSWYGTPDGRNVTGRPLSYDLAAFTQDFSTFAPALPSDHASRSRERRRGVG